MNNPFVRTEKIIGIKNLEKLKNSTVVVVGLGGVGSYVVEALARTAVGHLILIDYDTVDISNINRQIPASIDTLGASKAKVLNDRIKKINPDIKSDIVEKMVMPEELDYIFEHKIDYLVDAIDMINSKIALIKECKQRNIAIISAMGAGNRMQPTMLAVDDIYKTQNCPLARIVRRELRKTDIKELKVVYSKEEAIKPQEHLDIKSPGSNCFVPATMGMIIASEVIKDIIEWK